MTTSVRRLRPSRQPPGRDTDVTPFAAILRRLVARVPGAYAAALVDQEGETVDYTGLLGSFELRVAAAEVRLALDVIGRATAGATSWMIVRGERGSIVCRMLPDGYAVVVLLRRRAGFAASRRAYAVCERELAEEAGWSLTVASVEGRVSAPRGRRADGCTPLPDAMSPVPSSRRPLPTGAMTPLDTSWWNVEVEVDARGRPRLLRVAGREEPLAVEVLGSVMGLIPRERGFRVRTAHGEELTLVREARRIWYADAPIR